MQNKNKKQFEQNRLVFFAEVQEVTEGELDSVKKMKEQGGDELDVSGMVADTNKLITNHKDQFDQLPKEFTDLLHNEIVNYFTQSTGRFEKDEKKGLSAEEFKKYRGEMVAKAEEIIKEYAPTKEEKEAMDAARASAKEASNKAENIKTVEAKDIQEDPGSIENVETLKQKYTEYDGWNASLQREGSDALASSGSFQKSFADYKKSINGINSYRKFGKWVKGAWGSITSAFSSGPAPVDPEIQRLRDAQAAAKTRIDAISEKYTQSKEKLRTYGEKLGNVSNGLKTKATEKRDSDLKEIRAKQDETKEQKEAREAKKKQLEEQQKNMIGKRDEMTKYQEEVSKGKDTEEKRIDTAKLKQDQLGRYGEMLRTSQDQIDEALKNPNITEEQKTKLEEAKKSLADKSTEIDAGLKASNMVIESGGQAAAAMEGEEKDNAAKSLSLQSHLKDQVGPGIKRLDDSIQALEEAKMQYASKEEQAVDLYGKIFESYDTIDQAIDNSVLKNNLANEQLTKSLENSKKILDNTTVEGPGIWESTIGIIPSTVGGAVSAFGEFCFDQALWLSKQVDGLKGSGWYWPAKIGSEVVNFTIGTAGGIIEMAGGLLTMVGTPGDALNGMGALIGRDPVTGEFTEKTAGDAWVGMLKAIVSYDDWAGGRPGLALGKIFPQVVLALTGGGAATAGKEAAQAAFTVAREAGSGVLSATGKGAIAFAKGAAIDLAETGKGIGKFVAGGENEANLAVRAAKGAKTFVVGAEGEGNALARLGKGVKAFAVGAEGEASGVSKLGQAAKAAPGKVLDAAKAAPKRVVELGQSMAAQIERLWGGKKFEGLRAAKTEAAMVEELTASSGKYEEFRASINKIKEENPGISDVDAKIKLQGQNLKLFTDGVQYEGKLKKLDEAQKVLDDMFKASLNSEEKAGAADTLLAARKKAQQGMIESSSDYNKFKKLLDQKDPQAAAKVQEFQKILETGDPEKIAAWKKTNVPSEWGKAFDFMENKVNYGQTLNDISVLQKIDKAAFKNLVTESGLPPGEAFNLLRLPPEQRELFVYLRDFEEGKMVNLGSDMRGQIYKIDKEGNEVTIFNKETGLYEMFDLDEFENKFISSKIGERVERIKAQVKDLDPAQLEEFIKKYNSAEKLMGDGGLPYRTLFRDSEKVVGFDEAGQLKIFKLREDFKVENLTMNHLSPTQVDEIRKMFEQHFKDTRYNNAAMTLDFVGFLRQAREMNPELSMLDAFGMFKMDGAGTVAKYGGGNCFALSEDFLGRLRAMGVEGNMMGNYGVNAAMMMEKGKAWTEAMEYIQRTHGSTLVKYTDTVTGEIKYLHFEMGAGEMPMKELVGDQVKLLELPAFQSYVQPELGISNASSSVLKNQLRVRNKIHIMEDTNFENTMSLDLMKGKLFVNGDIGVGIAAEAGQSSLDFRQLLKRPNDKVSVMVNGAPVEMTNAESLRLYLETVRIKFRQPADFTDNMMYLMSHTDEYYDNFMLQGAKDLYRRNNP